MQMAENLNRRLAFRRLTVSSLRRLVNRPPLIYNAVL